MKSIMEFKSLKNTSTLWLVSIFTFLFSISSKADLSTDLSKIHEVVEKSENQMNLRKAKAMIVRFKKLKRQQLMNQQNDGFIKTKYIVPKKRPNCTKLISANGLKTVYVLDSGEEVTSCEYSEDELAQLEKSQSGEKCDSLRSGDGYPQARSVKVGIWGKDERRPLWGVNENNYAPEYRFTPDEKEQLKAVSAVLCMDEKFNMFDGSGFIVNIDEFGASQNRNYDIIATDSHVLNNEITGKANFCEYYPDLLNQPDYAISIERLTCGINATDKINGGVHGKDWCYAKVNKVSDGFGSLKIKFGDKTSWKKHEQDSSKYIVGGYRPDTKKIEFSQNCSPDDKAAYPILKTVEKNQGFDYSNSIVGNCDDFHGASGGPMLERQENGELQAIALVDGELGPVEEGSYNPTQARGGLYTRFNMNMKSVLNNEVRKIERKK